MSFPKDKPPHSVKVLHSWIAMYAKETGQVPERIMRSVSYMIASMALERARDDTGAPLRPTGKWPARRILISRQSTMPPRS
jgi:hypothetical protein